MGFKKGTLMLQRYQYMEKRRAELPYVSKQNPHLRLLKKEEAVKFVLKMTPKKASNLVAMYYEATQT